MKKYARTSQRNEIYKTKSPNNSPTPHSSDTPHNKSPNTSWFACCVCGCACSCPNPPIPLIPPIGAPPNAGATGPLLNSPSKSSIWPPPCCCCGGVDTSNNLPVADTGTDAVSGDPCVAGPESSQSRSSRLPMSALASFLTAAWAAWIVASGTEDSSSSPWLGRISIQTVSLIKRGRRRRKKRMYTHSTIFFWTVSAPNLRLPTKVSGGLW